MLVRRKVVMFVRFYVVRSHPFIVHVHSSILGKREVLAKARLDLVQSHARQAQHTEVMLQGFDTSPAPHIHREKVKAELELRRSSWEVWLTRKYRARAVVADRLESGRPRTPLAFPLRT